MAAHQSRQVSVNGISTHYLEAGDGPPLVLLHSGEFGACAELSWEFNIPALSDHFRVLAPDWLGYGRTDKAFFFDDMRKRRIDHIAGFLEAVAGGNPPSSSAILWAARCFSKSPQAPARHGE